MLHTLEMPSFLTDDSELNLAVHYSSESLGGHRNLREKVSGNSCPSYRQSTNENIESDPDHRFDTIYGDYYVANGDMKNDPSLSSLPNGRLSVSSSENKLSHNDGALSVNSGPNGVMENGKKSVASNGVSRISTDGNSLVSANGGPIQPPTDSTVKLFTTSNDIALEKSTSVPLVSANPPNTAPLTYNYSLVPATPLTDTSPVRGTPSSPHRFSSPPAYFSTNSAVTPTSSATGSSQLKHRHTLQVPKPGPSRSSKDDGDESAIASGRFSPTVATPGVRRVSLNLARRNTQSIHSNMPHEEISPDDDARRWAKAIQQKRASKRKRKDEEDDDRVVVGTKVDQNHVNWVTAYNMLTGIRFTVSRTNAKLDRSLTDVDFEQKHKFSFDITGNELTPSAKYDFKFKDYAPWVFRHLRARFKLDPADYLMSLTSKYILSELGSPGKSGSFFYFSRDYKYIIKTIHHAEHKFLRKILKDYYNHVVDNPNTLLSQFYGLHRVKIPYGRKIHFVVMNNLFPPHRDIHQTFDLKGSTIGRDFREEDLKKNPRATMKDLNWLRRYLHLEFGPEKKRLFIYQMEKDVHLLQRLKIMDYSLLVGIHDLQKGNQENLRDKTLRVFQPGGDISPEDPNASQHGVLLRTPSKLENARKARELRQIIKQEKPIPMGQTSSRMPDYWEEGTPKRELTFYSDDGGFQATHEDNRPGEEIYYLGIIDLLTHYGTVKRLENFWKGLSHDKHQISPVPSVPYGDRFIKFITKITMPKEEAEREEASHQDGQRSGLNSTEAARQSSERQNSRRANTTNLIQTMDNQAIKADMRGSGEESVPERTLTTIRSPSTEHANDRTAMTLPIVDEVGESSSTGGRSGRSNHGDDEHNYLTLPKDRGLGHGSKTPTSTGVSSFDLVKALPQLPREAGSEPMKENGFDD